MSKLHDSEIEQWVLREIDLSGAVGSREISVLSRNGVVTLKGTVNSFASKLAAADAAEIANGVVSVINEIRVRLFVETTRGSSSDVSTLKRPSRMRSYPPANLRARARRHATR